MCPRGSLGEQFMAFPFQTREAGAYPFTLSRVTRSSLWQTTWLTRLASGRNTLASWLRDANPRQDKGSVARTFAFTGDPLAAEPDCVYQPEGMFAGTKP